MVMGTPIRGDVRTMATPTRLAANDGFREIDRGRFWGLAFSRDGKRITYASHDVGVCRILETDLDGREKRVLVTLADDVVVSEVHGWSAGDRFLVFSAARSGMPHEIWVADAANRRAKPVIRESFFGGWDDANDAFLVWDRVTGSRRTRRIRFSRNAAEGEKSFSEHSQVLAAEAAAFLAEKVSEDPADKRFTVYRMEDGEPREIATVAATCRTSRVRLSVSPSGEYVHVSALGPSELAGAEPISFDLVLATDGSHRRMLAPKGWVSGERALVFGRNRQLDLVDVATGVRSSFLELPVDQFAVSRDGYRVLFTSGHRLLLAPVPPHVVRNH